MGQIKPVNTVGFFGSHLLKSFYQHQGRPGINARRISGVMIIKHKLNLSGEETVMQIQVDTFLRYSPGYSSYEADPVFSPTLFVEIRKRLGPDKFYASRTAIINTAFSSMKRVAKKRKIA